MNKTDLVGIQNNKDESLEGGCETVTSGDLYIIETEPETIIMDISKSTTNISDHNDEDLCKLDAVPYEDQIFMFDTEQSNLNVFDPLEGSITNDNDELPIETEQYFVDTESVTQNIQNHDNRFEENSLQHDIITNELSNELSIPNANVPSTKEILGENFENNSETTKTSILEEYRIISSDDSSEPFLEDTDNLESQKSTKELTTKVKLLSSKAWRKKNFCPYCLNEISHFARHLQRHHQEESTVKELLAIPINDSKRRDLLNSIRREGNFLFTKQTNLIRPVRRPTARQNKTTIFGLLKNEQSGKDQYVACPDCLGFFKRQFLGRHRKTCKSRSESTDLNKRENHLTETQLFMICSGANKEFYDKLQLKSEIFKIMRPDERSKVAMGDILICSYGESLLLKHKQTHLKTSVSNKMRELGRLLIELRKMTKLQNLFDILKPEFFGDIVSATKIVSGYDDKTQTFKATTLPLHMGTTLRQVCDIAKELISKKCRFLAVNEPDESLKDIKQLKDLIQNDWNLKLTHLAPNKLIEKTIECPIKRDFMYFQNYALEQANKASKNITERNETEKEYNRLLEYVFALTSVHNTKFIEEIQDVKLSTYDSHIIGDKRSKILFPKYIQTLFDVILSVRLKFVSATNEYLFANTSTENASLNGYNILEKIAAECGVENQNMFTSTQLREKIDNVLEVMNTPDPKTLSQYFYNIDSDDSDADSDNMDHEIDLTNDNSQDGLSSTISVAEKKLTKKTVKPKIARSRWTEKQKDAITDFFKDHITNKKAPKKNEIDKFKKRYKKLFEERSWIKIKAYVYNSYKKQ